jgi:citrate lyase subunit beta/citryl-CoA lyase
MPAVRWAAGLEIILNRRVSQVDLDIELLRCGLITNGLRPELIKKASTLPIDFLDIALEDGVPDQRKAEARLLIAECLRTCDWSGKLVFVRVNGVETGFLEDDVEALVAARPTGLILGKCQSPDDIRYLDGLVAWAEREAGIPPGSTRLGAMIERIRALQTVDEIALASPRMAVLAIGPSDLGNEVGYRRSYRGREIETLYAQQRIIVAAHAAGLISVAPPFTFYKDVEGSEEYARYGYELGHDLGMCLSPRQIEAVSRAFSPGADEVAWAQSVLQGEQEAAQDARGTWTGRGITAGGSPDSDKNTVMMDPPHVVRANGIMRRVELFGTTYTPSASRVREQ